MSIFSKVSFKKPKSSTFDLSHNYKMTLDMGYLIPTMCMEIVPGDKFSVQTSQILRFQPILAPLMHEVNVTHHYFFVPNRLLWSNWEKFITGGEDGLSSVSLPVTNNFLLNIGTLADYLGMPCDLINKDKKMKNWVNLLPFAGYQLIWNEYYRDQNLIDPIEISLKDGYQDGGVPENAHFFVLRRRAWQHDYFTSALPWTQKGNAVKLPVGDFNSSLSFVPGFSANLYDVQTKQPFMEQSILGTKKESDPSGNIYARINDLTEQQRMVSIDNSKSLRVDMDVKSTSINDLRRAIRLQEWLEKNARAGSRYVESLLAHFGVKSSDARLQRPEFLGGGTSPVQFSEVLQTESTTDKSPQGNMSGHGLNLGSGAGFKRFFEEHGFLYCITSVMPKTGYMNGFHRHWTKLDKFDYFWPEFEQIGEQAVYERELYYDANTGDPSNEVFGYVPRYAEYKYMMNRSAGDMRSTLGYWHLDRFFDPKSKPKLNKDFIECSPRTDIFAVQDKAFNKLIMQCYHKVKAKRKMRYYGSPRL